MCESFSFKRCSLEKLGKGGFSFLEKGVLMVLKDYFQKRIPIILEVCEGILKAG